MQTSFYPYELAAKAGRLLKAADIEEGVRYLAETWGLDQVGYRDWTAKRTLDDDEQQFFKLGPEDTLYEITRTAFAYTPQATELLTPTGERAPGGFPPAAVAASAAVRECG